MLTHIHKEKHICLEYIQNPPSEIQIPTEAQSCWKQCWVFWREEVRILLSLEIPGMDVQGDFSVQIEWMHFLFAPITASGTSMRHSEQSFRVTQLHPTAISRRHSLDSNPQQSGSARAQNVFWYFQHEYSVFSLNVTCLGKQFPSANDAKGIS